MKYSKLESSTIRITGDHESASVRIDGWQTCNVLSNLEVTAELNDII